MKSIKEMLELHKKWIEGKKGGIMFSVKEIEGLGLELMNADLSDTDLSNADLSNADLRYANLRYADLSNANLRYANLSYANLSGANIDYACWPIWCGGLKVKVDRRIWVQLAYHLCSLEVDDEECKKYRELLIPIAQEFHRIEECGDLK